MVVHQMSKVWVFDGSGTKKHKRDIAVRYSSCLGAPKSRGYNESLVGDRSVISYGSSAVRFVPSE